LDVLAALEGVFVSRGYRIVRSSEENRYLLIRKGKSTTAVGYSFSAGSISDGEAEMFVSMGQNDSAGSLLFISPPKISRQVKAVFEKEGVEIWNRTDIVSALGEFMISHWSREEDGPSAGTTFEEIGSKEVGGFRIREVDLGSRRVREKAPTQVSVDAAPRVRDPGPEKEMPDPEPEQVLMDMPLFMGDESPEEKPAATQPEADPEVSPPPPARNVPEDILLDPWAGFEQHLAKEDEKKRTSAERKEGPDKKAPAKTVNPWEGSTLAPLKFDVKEALSLAGGGEDDKVRRENRPFLLLEASYSMVPEDGAEPVENDGTYLYDCLRGEVTDIPGSLFDEVANLPDRWDGKEGPGALTNLKDDHNSAITVLRKRIADDKVAKDRKVRETLMSTIYRGIEYRFDPRSLKLISSRRVMLPYWVKDGKGGKAEWEVNAFLGKLTK